MLNVARLRTHSERVQAANELLKCDKFRFERITPVMRRAFVNLFLVEEIYRMYDECFKEALVTVIADHPTISENDILTELSYGEQKNNLLKNEVLAEMLIKIFGFARIEVFFDNYNPICKCMSENAILSAARNEQKEPQLRKIMTNILKTLGDGAIEHVKSLKSNSDKYALRMRKIIKKQKNKTTQVI